MNRLLLFLCLACAANAAAAEHSAIREFRPRNKAKTAAQDDASPPRILPRQARHGAPASATAKKKRASSLPAPSFLSATGKPSAAQQPFAIQADRNARHAQMPPEHAGLLTEEAAQGLQVRGTWSDSLAQRLGLRPGDILTHFNGRRIRSSAELSEELAALPAGTRAGAVVLRSGRAVALQESLSIPSENPSRDPSLTSREKRIQEEHLQEAERQVPSTVKTFKSPSFRIAAGETLWIRFPKGIPHTAAEGDILEAETATPMSTDASLDFLAVPSGSRLWLQAVSVKDSGRDILLRLHAYKIALADGHVYPCSAQLTDVSGDQSLLRMSRGGTLVAAPSEGSPLLASADRSYLLRFLQPLTIYESRGYYLAGPGLWFKSPQTEGVRSFEVTRVVENRSAEQAGIRLGDRVLSVGGKSVEKLGFQEAVSRLYGPQGSSVDVRLLRGGLGGRGETVSLRRGANYRSGLGLTVRREGNSILVKKVLPGSPAAKAGLCEDDVLLLLGEANAASLSDAELRAKLKEDLAGANAPVFKLKGGSERKVPLTRGEFAAPIEPAFLSQ
ncbi:MAG: PDZ domain-containing protein [Elusimicrobiota bacterium]|jgi:S1-C subfamily serine protease